MTQDKNTLPPADALLARYHAAQAALDAPNNRSEISRPSEQTRNQILHYAASIATNSVAARVSKEKVKSPIYTQKAAANDSQWKLRALATVAVFGITSLLLLQWERGTSEEKDAAYSTARPSVAAPATEVAPQVAPALSATATPTTSSPASPAVAPAAKLAKTAPARDKIIAPTTPPVTMQNHAKPFPALADAAVSPLAGQAPPLAPKPEQLGTESAIAAASPVPAPAAAAMATAPLAPTLRATPSAKRLGQNAAPAIRPAPSNQALFTAIARADTAAMQQAIDGGADKNAKSNGTPAISLCVQSGKLYLVQLLMTAGADVNATDTQGTTPLAHARARGFDAIAEALVGLGAR
jgi:hypothetical protein